MKPNKFSSYKIIVYFVKLGLQVQITPSTNTKTPVLKKYNGPIDCIKKIYSSYGIRGIYKGQLITMLREFNGSGCYFLVYEYFMQRAMYEEQKSRRELHSWKPCLYGAAAGLSYLH